MEDFNKEDIYNDILKLSKESTSEENFKEKSASYFFFKWIGLREWVGYMADAVSNLPWWSDGIENDWPNGNMDSDQTPVFHIEDVILEINSYHQQHGKKFRRLESFLEFLEIHLRKEFE